MAVWPKVSARLLVDGTCLEDARQILFGNAYTGVGLAVFEQDVVTGSIFFDKTVFQE